MAFVALAVGATATGIYFAVQEKPDCPGHWHSTFLVFMDGQQVHFNRPVFLRAPDGIKDYDLHADDQVMHYHPQFADRCTPMSHFLNNLGIQVTDSSIMFNEYFGGNQGTYRENATHSLQIHFQPFRGEWREESWDWVGKRQLRPGEKVLITYGELTPALVQSQKDLVRDLPDHYLPLEYREDPQAEVPDEHPPLNGTSSP